MLTGDQKARSAQMQDDGEESSSRWPMLSLLRILWNRKVHILIMWLVLASAVMAGVALWPATYRAETLIVVNQQKIPEKFVSAAVSVELQDRLATISQEILSNTRLEKVMDSFKLYEKERHDKVLEEVLEIMRNDIHVTTEKGWIQNRPGAFRVSFEGRNPNTVADVANQLGNLFVEENLRNRETVASGTSEFMKSQLDEAREKLELQEKKLSEFKVAYNGELPQQAGSLEQDLTRLQVQLQGNQDALNRASQNRITLQSAVAVAQSTDSTLRRIIQASSDLNGRTKAGFPQRKSAQIQEELEQLTARFSSRYPDVIALTKLLEQTKEREKQAAAAAGANDVADGSGLKGLPDSPEAAQIIAAQHERIESLNAELAVVNSELKIKQADQEKIVHAIEAVQARLHRIPVREQELAEVTRDYETSRDNYNSLQNKIFAADMATDMERGQKSERFTVVDPARVPEKPVSPNRPLWAAIGSVGTLAISIAVWLPIGMRTNKFLGEWELPEGTVVLGRVPAIAAALPHRRRLFGVLSFGGAAALLLAGAVSLAGFLAVYR